MDLFTFTWLFLQQSVTHVTILLLLSLSGPEGKGRTKIVSHLKRMENNRLPKRVLQHTPKE
jgi:hypothetical protein